MLALTLQRTGRAGLVREYFDQWDSYTASLVEAKFGVAAGGLQALDWPERFRAICEVATTPNGIFGAKLHWHQLPALLEAVGMAPNLAVQPIACRADSTLRSSFPNLRFVWLRRENQIAQAISHYIALKSGRWYLAARDPHPDPATVSYDFDAIAKLAEDAQRDCRNWRQFLLHAQDVTLALTYEELDADYYRSVGKVLDFLEVSLGGKAIPPPGSRRQADQRSLEWERRFREERQTRPVVQVGTGS